MSIFKMKFYFYILPRLYISFIIEQLTDKVRVFVRKKENCTVLPSSLIFDLNQMNSDKIMDGSLFCSKVIFPFYENILIKISKF